MKKNNHLHDSTSKIRCVEYARLSLSVLVLSLVTGLCVADQSNGNDGGLDEPTSVKPPGNPTEVLVGAYLVGLSRISDSSAAFPTWDAEMFIDLSWVDPSLAFDGEANVFQGEEAEEKLSEIWSPDPEIQNEVEQRQTESVELILLPDGSVQYEERFGATLNAELDLARFPFDTQIFDLELQSFLWDEADVVFVVNPAQTGFDPDFQTPEWTVTDVETSLGRRSEIRDERNFSSYTFRVHAERNSGHYVLRMFIPLFIVMGLTFSAFWMPAEDRFRVGFLALLAVVASHTVIANQLPRLNYPTIADMLLFICYVFAMVLIVTAVAARYLNEQGDVVSALRIERRTRWVLPLLAGLGLSACTLILWF